MLREKPNTATKIEYMQSRTNAFNQHAFNKRRESTMHRQCEIKKAVQLFSRLPASEQIHHAVPWAQELHKTVKSSNKILQEFMYLPDFDLTKKMS